MEKAPRKDHEGTTTPPATTKNRESRLRRLSHSFAWALRHAAPQLGLTMTPDGFVPVEQLLQSRHAKLKGPWTVEEVIEMVATNDKQRFKLEERPARDYYPSPVVGDNDPDAADECRPTTVLCIRANQGHSLPGLVLDPTQLLQPLPPNKLAQQYPVIVHGTYRAAWPLIRQEGLKRMQRHYIHFATGLPSSSGVISGMRKSCQIYIYINGPKCARDGIAFYKSDNGVLLTAGLHDQGTLPVEYFSHVVDASDGSLLLDQRAPLEEDSTSIVSHGNKRPRESPSRVTHDQEKQVVDDSHAHHEAAAAASSGRSGGDDDEEERTPRA